MHALTEIMRVGHGVLGMNLWRGQELIKAEKWELRWSKKEARWGDKSQGLAALMWDVVLEQVCVYGSGHKENSRVWKDRVELSVKIQQQKKHDEARKEAGLKETKKKQAWSSPADRCCRIGCELSPLSLSSKQGNRTSKNQAARFKQHPIARKYWGRWEHGLTWVMRHEVACVRMWAESRVQGWARTGTRPYWTHLIGPRDGPTEGPLSASHSSHPFTPLHASTWRSLSSCLGKYRSRRVEIATSPMNDSFNRLQMLYQTSDDLSRRVLPLAC